MTAKPQLGKNIYKDALRRLRDSTQSARKCLKRIVNESPGPQTLAMLVTNIALDIGNIEAILFELDEFGRTAKDLMKGD